MYFLSDVPTITDSYDQSWHRDLVGMGCRQLKICLLRTSSNFFEAADNGRLSDESQMKSDLLAIPCHGLISRPCPLLLGLELKSIAQVTIGEAHAARINSSG